LNAPPKSGDTVLVFDEMGEEASETSNVSPDSLCPPIRAPVPRKVSPRILHGSSFPKSNVAQGHITSFAGFVSITSTKRFFVGLVLTSVADRDILPWPDIG
jgi:hypothetical protein